MHAHFGSRLKFESCSHHRHTHVSLRVLSVSSDLFDLSFHFISYLFNSLLPYTFYFPDVVDNKSAHFAAELRPLAKKNSSTG